MLLLVGGCSVIIGIFLRESFRSSISCLRELLVVSRAEPLSFTFVRTPLITAMSSVMSSIPVTNRSVFLECSLKLSSLSMRCLMCSLKNSMIVVLSLRSSLHLDILEILLKNSVKAIDFSSSFSLLV